jgi:metal-sulfur cluster biosynthetic enzyme
MMDADADLRFDYDGPPALQAPIAAALSRVVDPELALNIVDIGLVYGVNVGADSLIVRMTMTSAACPVTDLIVEEVEQELAPVAPPGTSVHVDLVWEPPWTPDRLSERARRFMGG